MRLQEKIADVRIEYPIQSLISNKASREKGDNCCLNCSLLKVELQMSSELKSAHEIIEVLQEEIKSTLRPSQLSQSSQHNLEVVHTPTEDNRSKWKSSKPGSYTRTRNYKNSDCKGISTENRYNVLLI